MNSLLQKPEETHSTRWEETTPPQMNQPSPQQKRPLLITLVLLLFLAIPGSLLLNQTIAKNPTQQPHHWIDLHLVGTGRSNFAAIGAQVMLNAGGKSWMKWVRGQDASHATNPLRFDVATLRSIDLVEIFWPDGRVERMTKLSVDRSYTLREGDPMS